VVSQARDRSNRTWRKIARPSSLLKRTGSFFSRGGRTKVSVVQGLLRVCSKKNLLPQRAMVVALREYFLRFLRWRK
jgi:hypothetical protein